MLIQKDIDLTRPINDDQKEMLNSMASRPVSADPDCPELTDKVKKVVVGDDVTDAQWMYGFYGYKNLKEIEFGDTVEMIGGGIPNFIFGECESLESVTIGSNVKLMPSNHSNGGIFADCQKMKKIVIKSEYLIEDPEDSLDDWFPRKGIDNRYKHLDDLKIYVPAAQLQRYKVAIKEYKDQIYALYLLGDTDLNCQIEATDATFIQRSAAGLGLPFTLNKKTANVDGDKNITVMDATFIQKYLADMQTAYKIGEQV